jgi:hypothetical protein
VVKRAVLPILCIHHTVMALGSIAKGLPDHPSTMLRSAKASHWTTTTIPGGNATSEGFIATTVMSLSQTVAGRSLPRVGSR